MPFSDRLLELSKELLIKWLSSYKFKNWIETETKKTVVTPEHRRQRAAEIAEILNDTERWHSHGRSINMRTLTDEIGLKIEDFSTIKELGPVVRKYFWLLKDYLLRGQLHTFIHTKEYF